MLLEAGDRVPADGRLLVAAALAVDESSLTGESWPRQKAADALGDHHTPIGDRAAMLYMNTLITRGRAEMVVTATGAQTEMGRISATLSATPDVTSPLQAQLDQLGRRLGAVAIGGVALLSVLQLMRGIRLDEVLLDAIALAVAAMPEGLPVVVTVALAIGMRQMARRHALVKRLASVETLGCVTVICSDKTGTLTMNQMTVRAFAYANERFTVTGEGYAREGQIQPEGGSKVDLAPMLLPLIACNDSRLVGKGVIGDPMEAALLILAGKGGINPDARPERISEIPFDAAHRYMATVHRDGDGLVMYVKGAPDVLLARCIEWLSVEGPRPMDHVRRQKIIGSSGNRVGDFRV